MRRVDRAALVLVALLGGLAVVAPAQWLSTVAFAASQLLALAPVLLVSVAIAAAIKASRAESLVTRAFGGRTATAVVFASLAGALSPLCSCGVVPLIAALLAGGVPLAPVMAFWLASPVMDPAMFVLTAGTIGFEFAVAKTLAAIGIGLVGGWGTALLQRAGGLDAPLRGSAAALAPGSVPGWAHARGEPVTAFWRDPARRAVFRTAMAEQARKLGTLMAIAFVLESLMLAYVPAARIAAWLGGDGPWAIPVAVALGIPAYLNGVAAVPLVGGLIDMGMSPAVGLAFMVAGGITSIPAALAVWALVRPRVFALYVAWAVFGALASADLYAAWLRAGL